MKKTHLISLFSGTGTGSRHPAGEAMASSTEPDPMDLDVASLSASDRAKLYIAKKKKAEGNGKEGSADRPLTGDSTYSAINNFRVHSKSPCFLNKGDSPSLNLKANYGSFYNKGDM